MDGLLSESPETGSQNRKSPGSGTRAEVRKVSGSQY
jgi:hypothetical protein